MGWSVGVFIVESLSVRASGSVRDHDRAESASIDSRENLKDGRFRSLRDSSRRLLCSHLTGALVRPRRCALHLWGFRGSYPCALVAASLRLHPYTLGGLELGAQHTFGVFVGSINYKNSDMYNRVKNSASVVGASCAEKNPSTCTLIHLVLPRTSRLSRA